VVQTREEKKLEAIVKAFERMEKREQHQRKKEAQLEQSKGKPKDKDKDKDKDSGGAGRSERDSGRSDTTASSSSQKVTKQHSVVRQASFLVMLLNVQIQSIPVVYHLFL